MKCSKCKSVIPEGFKFCPNCGEKVIVLDTPPNITGGVDKWQTSLPLIGAGVGLLSGLIVLTGWFSPWTSLDFGNGPQLIMLPFGLGAGAQLLGSFGILGSIVGSVEQITGWFLLAAILLAIVSIVLIAMGILSIWMGVKCLEYRSDIAMIPTVKSLINRIGTYTLTGIIFVVVVMVLVSIFQIGQSSIGGGLTAMAFGFIAGFIAVIYLKPHLR